MTARSPSLARLDVLEKAVGAERARRADLLARLEGATLRRDLALELLRPPEGAHPLSVFPWLAAVASALAALYAAFAAYVAVLGGGVPWTTSGLVAVLVSLTAGAASRADGAGGNARANLRMGSMAIALLSALLLLLFVARRTMTADELAPTEAATSLEPASDAEDIAFAQRLRRGPATGARLREGFWASLLGAGVVVWSFAMELAITNAGFVDRRWEATWLATGCMAGLTIGVFVGFRRPLGGYGSLVRRTLFVIALGGMLAAAMVVLTLLVNEAAGRSRASASAGMMVALGLIALAGAAAHFGWLRFDLEVVADDELPTARRQRLVAFGALTAAALVSLASASDTARCLLGSAQACAAVADDAIQGGDPSGRLAYVRRGCLHGDAALCRQAGDLALRGVGAPPDPREAERLLRHGCTLDGSACRELHVLELESSCAAKHAFACLELAPEVARGTLGPPNPPRAADLRTKACLLGLDQACSR